MKNILALPNDFPIDKYLEEDSEEDGRQAANETDLKFLQEQMENITRRLETVTTSSLIREIY